MMIINLDMDSLEAVRERCQLVYGHVRTGRSAHWALHSDAMNEVADYMRKLINRDYSGDVQNIPPHSRCRHHSPAYLSTLTLEQRVDLIVYSALLDAGAGDRWRFETPQGTYVRSEGIAQAVQLMFTQCFFERDLEATTIEDLEQAFQVTPDNPMAGLHARLQMLHGLGRQLRTESSIFPTGKPHDLLLQRGIHNNASSFFRHVIMPAFGPLINPPRGDIWPYRPLSVDVPFHKLLQWLTLSILDAGKIDFPRAQCVHLHGPGRVPQWGLVCGLEGVGGQVCCRLSPRHGRRARGRVAGLHGRSD